MQPNTVTKGNWNQFAWTEMYYITANLFKMQLY